MPCEFSDPPRPLLSIEVLFVKELKDVRTKFVKLMIIYLVYFTAIDIYFSCLAEDYFW